MIAPVPVHCFSITFTNTCKLVSAGFIRMEGPILSHVTGPAGSVVEHPLRDREVVGSIPGRAIPKALKMVPVATLLGAQHYKASTGFCSPNKTIAQLTSQHLQK